MGKKKKNQKTKMANTTATMNIDHILAQLSSLAENSNSFITGKPEDAESDAIWKADVEACEQATAILSALQDEDIEDPDQVHDLIADYNAIADERRAMHEKYEVPAPVVGVGGQAFCPECKFQIYHYPRHCPNCGKPLDYDRRKNHD